MEQTLRTTLEIFDVWGRWFKGEHFAETDQLWGLSMLFWARFGKTVEFVGALTIILEILGAARLRKFGLWLHRLNRLRSVWSLSRDSSIVLIASLKLLWKARKPGPEVIDSIGGLTEWTPRRIWLSGIAILVGVMVWLPHLTSLWHVYGWTVLIGRDYQPAFDPNASFLRFLSDEITAVAKSFFGSMVICLFLLGPLIVSLAITLSAAIGTLFDVLFVEPFAKILDRANLDQLRRFIALIMLLVGFHFDLLTS